MHLQVNGGEVNGGANAVVIDQDDEADDFDTASESSDMAVNYDVEDGTDPADVHSKTSSIKVDFNRAKPEFFFIQLEMHLESSGCKSQWVKRLIMQKNLPSDVLEDIEDILRKGKATAGATAYKVAKDRILELYGPRPEEVYKKAKDLQMTSKPSHLCMQLINILCPEHPDLLNCCCEKVISGMWREQLPPVVKSAVANMQLGNGNLMDTLKHADAVFAANQGAAGVAAVEQQQDEVAAFKPKNNNKSKPKNKVKKGGQGASVSGETPPPGCCNVHKEHGKAAYYCRMPHSCPWAMFTTAPPPIKSDITSLTKTNL